MGEFASRILCLGEQTLGTLSSRVPYVEYSKDGHALLVICNTANSEQLVKLPMRHEGLEMTNCLTGVTETPETVLTFAPYEYRIYTR